MERTPTPAIAQAVARSPWIARERLSRAASFVRAWAGLFPLTFLGVCVLVAAGAAFWALGVVRLDLVLLVACVVAAIVVLLTVVFAVMAALLLRTRVRGARTWIPLVVEAGHAVPTGFEVPLPMWLPGITVAWTWRLPRLPEPPSGVTGASSWWTRLLRRHPPGDRLPDVWQERTFEGLGEMVVAHRRTRMQSLRRLLHVHDMLGLASISWHHEEAVDVTVLPARGALGQMPALSGFITGEDLSDPSGDPYGDRVDMRQYVPGDSPRMILWKVYARSRRLMVRIPERALTVRPRGCAYVVAGSGDEPSAAVARVVVERGLLGEPWCLGADGAGDVVSTPWEAMRVISASGDARGETSFPTFLQRVERQGYGYCLLFVPPVAGPWIAPVRDAILRSGLRVYLFVGVDGIERDRTLPSTVLRHVLLQAPPEQPLQAGDVVSLARGLSDVVRQTFVVDRRTGVVHGGLEALVGEGAR